MHQDTFAELHRSSSYNDEPPLIQSMATAAEAARTIWYSLEQAAHLTHVDAPDMYEPITVIELSAYRQWQEIENAGQELYSLIHPDDLVAAAAPADDDPPLETRATRVLGIVKGTHP